MQVHGLAYGQIRILALVGSLFTAVLIVLILAYDPPGLEPPGRFGHAFGREMLRWTGVFGLCTTTMTSNEKVFEYCGAWSH